MSDYVLTITTVRELDNKDWAAYKRMYDSHPDTNKIDWHKLETEGSYLDVTKLPTETVESLYTLEKSTHTNTSEPNKGE
jgi:hypothetical protein